MCAKKLCMPTKVRMRDFCCGEVIGEHCCRQRTRAYKYVRYSLYPCLFIKSLLFIVYCTVASSNMSRLEAHAGFLRFLTYVSVLLHFSVSKNKIWIYQFIQLWVAIWKEKRQHGWISSQIANLKKSKQWNWLFKFGFCLILSQWLM